MKAHPTLLIVNSKMIAVAVVGIAVAFAVAVVFVIVVADAGKVSHTLRSRGSGVTY